MALPASDTFTGTNWDSISLTNWTLTTAQWWVYGNAAGTNSTAVMGARWLPDTFQANHYAQATIARVPGAVSMYIGPAVRMRQGYSGTTFNDCYAYVVYQNGVTNLYKILNNQFTQLGSAGTAALSDVLRLDCSGSTITPKKNGSVADIGAQTDTGLGYGQAGLFGSGNALATTSGLVDDFSAGDISTFPVQDSFYTYGQSVALTTYSANWTYMTGAFQILATHNAVSAGGDGARNLARWNAATFPDDQYSEIKVLASGGQYLGVAARLSSGAVTGYFTNGNNSNSSLEKLIAGTGTTLTGGGAAWAANDLIRLECSGSSIGVLKNGATLFSPVTDTSIASGAAGLTGYGYSDIGCYSDYWIAGEISSGSTLTQTRYRWRNDDGSETTATWKEAENTAAAIGANTVVRLRVQIDSTGDPAASQFRLEYCEQGQTNWQAVLP